MPEGRLDQRGLLGADEREVRPLRLLRPFGPAGPAAGQVPGCDGASRRLVSRQRVHQCGLERRRQRPGGLRPEPAGSIPGRHHVSDAHLQRHRRTDLLVYRERYGH